MFEALFTVIQGLVVLTIVGVLVWLIGGAIIEAITDRRRR